MNASHSAMKEPQRVFLPSILSTLNINGCLHFRRSRTCCTVVSSSGRMLYFVLSLIIHSAVALRCFYCDACGESVTEPPCTRNRLTVWAWPECSVTQRREKKKSLILSLYWWRLLSRCCLCRHGRSGQSWSLKKSPQMMLTPLEHI